MVDTTLEIVMLLDSSFSDKDEYDIFPFNILQSTDIYLIMPLLLQ